MLSEQPEQPQNWLGHEERVEERLDPGAVARVAATLGSAPPAPGAALPWLWHWAFFQPAPAADQLGADGHAFTGGFLPPMPGLQRMWAGGRLTFRHPLIVGEPAVRRSVIRHIERKEGRQAGAMTFVTVDHHYQQHGREAIHEQQDLVYRQPRPLQARPGEPLPALDWRQEITPHPTLLFRYSAVTFNGHRIHYDWPYATEEEGYAGLVVHGPLIATLVMNAFLDAHPHATPTAMSFRGLRPLLCPGRFVAGGVQDGAGRARVFAGDQDGQSQAGTIEYHTRDHQQEAHR
ncbi:FAS1-like dehydratase domain-containing protein [Alloalcanivorax mobilis]|uniref:FAS1-like dehydratase domain-containing protein n=1 Tax=Alloalcanivorax mobilis TaxID=2019569 RepID=UPI000B5B35C5|nr:MaoC family dehydratase N-terminal domain-containing protein [Alloalcanivorax mobilis]ASK33871.1 transposase [Alcanivorax sp. N3-2A]|tara:strand:+ start:47306 stop:48175 length:870 start_codon:yes stop_codon:yes gene_type:complete